MNEKRSIFGPKWAVPDSDAGMFVAQFHFHCRWAFLATYIHHNRLVLFHPATSSHYRLVYPPPNARSPSPFRKFAMREKLSPDISTIGVVMFLSQPNS